MRKFSTRYGMNTTPRANGPGSGCSTINLGEGSLSMGRTVLWAKAPVASRIEAAAAASVLISCFIASSPFETWSTADDAHWRGIHRMTLGTNLELPQRLETCAKIFHDRLRLLPRGKVRTFRMALIVGQLGISLFGPLPRNRGDLLRKGAYHDWDLYALRSEEGVLVFPIELGRRHPGFRQPVEGDVVENIVSRQALSGAVKHPSDLPVGPDIMIDDPRGQADRRILDPIQRLRPAPHLLGIAETILVEE